MKHGSISRLLFPGISNQQDNGSWRDCVVHRCQGFPRVLHKVVGMVHARIDNAMPLMDFPLLNRECEGLPIRTDHYVDVGIVLRFSVKIECQTSRIIREVRGSADSVPPDVIAPKTAAT
jgi:hypothetical protein